MPLLGAPQEVAEEGRPDVPSGTSLLPAVLRQTAGIFVWQASSICGA